MKRRITVLLTVTLMASVLAPAPAQAIIHELVASHCAGGQGSHGNVDPPGQLNERGNSFARALQATKIYLPEFGVDQAGLIGFDAETGQFGPLPAPDPGVASLSVFVDPTRPSAKLGDFLFWVHFVETLDGEPIHVYLQIFDLDHPAFDRCAKLRG